MSSSDWQLPIIFFLFLILYFQFYLFSKDWLHFITFQSMNLLLFKSLSIYFLFLLIRKFKLFFEPKPHTHTKDILLLNIFLCSLSFPGMLCQNYLFDPFVELYFLYIVVFIGWIRWDFFIGCEISRKKRINLYYLHMVLFILLSKTEACISSEL